MVKEKRWDKLLYHLRTKPSSQEELAAIFDINERTVRRWLQELEIKHKDHGLELTKYIDPDTQVYYYGVYDTLPKQKHKPRKFTYRLAEDDSPYMTVMIPDKMGGAHPDWGDYIKIFPLADFHHGHRSSNREMMQRCVDRIVGDDNCLTFQGGDLTENSGRYSVGGGVYEQIMPPQQQQDEMTEIIRPLAHKCMFGSSGNHGYRSWKAVGLDPDMNIAKAFDIPYFLGQYHIDINWRDNLYTLVGYHGKGGAMSPKGRLDALIKTARLNEIADYHVMFHLHTRMQTEFVIPKRDRKNMKLIDHKSRAVLFGGFLNYWREYCDTGAMEKTFIGTYSLILCADGKKRILEEDFD